MAKLYKADGTIEGVKPKKTRWTVEEFQDLVDGYFEMMPGVPQKIIFNDLAALAQLPINHKATAIVTEQLKGKKLRYQPVLRGNVLILDKGEKM